MLHDRAYNRAKDWSKAIRKRGIDRDTQSILYPHDYYNNLHQYSKNTIRCSCGLCRRKTNNKGKNRNIQGNYAPSKNWKAADRRKLDSLDFQVQEIGEEND